MKKMLRGLTVLVVLAALALGAGASLAADAAWKTHVDKKFGFSMEYPVIFNKSETYVDGDGRSVFEQYASTADGDGKYALTVMGGKSRAGETAASRLKELTSLEEDKNGYVSGVEPLPGTARSQGNAYALDYADDSSGIDSVSHIYGLVGDGMIVEYSLRYPRAEAERFAGVVSRMDAALRLKGR